MFDVNYEIFIGFDAPVSSNILLNSYFNRDAAQLLFFGSSPNESLDINDNITKIIVSVRALFRFANYIGSLFTYFHLVIKLN